jgi:hypothetical protein
LRGDPVDIGKAIENHTKTNVPLIQNRITPDEIPETTKCYPAICYSLVSGIDDETFGDDSNTTEDRIQFTIATKSAAERETVHKQLKTSFKEFSGTMGGTNGKVIQAVRQINRVDQYDEKTKIYLRMVDFMFIYDDV